MYCVLFLGQFENAGIIFFGKKDIQKVDVLFLRHINRQMLEMFALMS